MTASPVGSQAVSGTAPVSQISVPVRMRNQKRSYGQIACRKLFCLELESRQIGDLERAAVEHIQPYGLRREWIDSSGRRVLLHLASLPSRKSGATRSSVAYPRMSPTPFEVLSTPSSGFGGQETVARNTCRWRISSSPADFRSISVKV